MMCLSFWLKFAERDGGHEVIFGAFRTDSHLPRSTGPNSKFVADLKKMAAWLPHCQMSEPITANPGGL
jgi:hypothetical protein